MSVSGESHLWPVAQPLALLDLTATRMVLVSARRGRRGDEGFRRLTMLGDQDAVGAFRHGMSAGDLHRSVQVILTVFRVDGMGRASQPAQANRGRAGLNSAGRGSSGGAAFSDVLVGRIPAG